VTPGAYTLSLSGLPSDCLASPKSATVASGSATTVNFTVICQLIAFSSERAGTEIEIYVMRRDGSNQRRLTFAGGFFGSYGAAWSPDGRTIAFGRNDLSANEGEENYDTEIYTVDVDGAGEHQLTNDTFSDYWPTWSPDGSKIAFVSDRGGQADVYLMNPDGSGITPLTNSTVGEYQLAWSPDGSKIAFGASGANGPNIYVMNADGTGVTQLTNTGTDARPAWSPDGSKIAFESDRNGAGQREVYVMDANGRNQTRLTFGGRSMQPTWSADGTKIAFTSFPDPVGDVDIYLMNVDGSGIQRLTTAAGFDNWPAFQR
jgi:Tol biopolymer transport system component